MMMRPVPVPVHTKYEYVSLIHRLVPEDVGLLGVVRVVLVVVVVEWL